MMAAEKENIGICPACNTPLIRNRQDKHEHFHVALDGKDPPEKAYYPNFYHEIDAVWCPGCGLAKSVSFPRMNVSVTNPEFSDWIEKNTAD